MFRDDADADGRIVDAGKVDRNLFHVHRAAKPQCPRERLTALRELEACGPRMQVCTAPRQSTSCIDAQDGCGARLPGCRYGTDDHSHQV